MKSASRNDLGLQPRRPSKGKPRRDTTRAEMWLLRSPQCPRRACRLGSRMCERSCCSRTSHFGSCTRLAQLRLLLFLLEGRVWSLAAVRRCILSASLAARRSLSSVPPGLLVSSHPLCFLFLVFDGSSHELFELSVLRQSKYPPRLVSDLCFATISFCYACATEIHKNLDYAPPPPPTGNL